MSNKYNVGGLKDWSVENSRRQYGANDFPIPESESFWEKLKGNFEDPLIKILVVALVITMGLAVFGFAEWTEGVGIATSVFIATFVSTYSEFKNEESFRELQREANCTSSLVFRNGLPVKVMIANIVVGGSSLLSLIT